MLSKTKIKEDFSFDKKKKLAAKISNMTNKDHLKKIKDIIFAENPDIIARKSDRGYLMYFQNYSNNTYYKIEKFINRIDLEKIEKHTKTITKNSDQLVLSSEDHSTDYILSKSRLRYSNHEKRLIKRRQYEKLINENLTDINNNLMSVQSESDAQKNKNYSDSNSDNDTDSNINNDNDEINNPEPIKIKKITRNKTNLDNVIKNLTTNKVSANVNKTKPRNHLKANDSLIPPVVKNKKNPDVHEISNIFSKNRN